ncbi:MAG: transglycosylase SLT domain-containing protein [Metamycoplasmataceae bacterium]
MQTEQRNTVDAYASLTSSYGSDMTGMVTAAGDYVGVKASNMTSIGMVESNLKPNAKNTKSSATGLFQFTGGTWNDMVTKYGAQYGIPKGTKPTDPAANSLMAAMYIKENNDIYSQQFGSDAGLTETYLGHFLGPTGRKDFMTALKENPNGLASDYVRANQVKANPNVFTKGATLQQVYDHFTNKLGGIESKPQAAPVKAKAQNEHSVYDRIGDAALTRQFKQEEGQSASLQSSTAESDLLNRAFGATPRATGAAFGSVVRDDISVVDTERGTFDGTWDLVTDAWKLNGMGASMNESLYWIGIKNKDPSLEFVREAFYGKEDHSPLRDDKGNYMGQTEPFEMSEELIEKVLATGLGKKWFGYLQGALTPQDFIQKLNSAHDLAKADKARSQAGLGAQLTSGVAGAVFDPLSYATLGVGAAANIGRNVGQRVFLAGVEGSAMSLASEWLVDESTKGGIDTDYKMAASTGFLFSGGLRLGMDSVNTAIGNRMKAQAESVEAGVPDISKAPAHDPNNPQNYVMSPNEPDAVVMGDGTIFTGSHPFNPMRHFDDAKVTVLDNHLDLGVVNKTLPELYITAYNDPNSNALASTLFKADVGLEGGGKRVNAGMVAEDVLALENQRDFTQFHQLDKALVEAGLGGRFGLARTSAAQHQMQLQLIEAIESGDFSRLTPEQKAAADILTEFYTRKFDSASAPSKFGNPNAKPVFETRRDPKNYVQLQYDKGKRMLHIARFGGEDNLKITMRENYMAQFDGDHNGLKARAAEHFKEQLKDVDPKQFDVRLRQLVEEHAETTAFGVSNQGKFSYSSAIDDVGPSESLAGFENNNFTEARSIFDPSFVSIGTDGMPFKVNDMRFTDIRDMVQTYSRRMNGDIALHSTGKTTKEIKDEILALPNGVGKDALKDAVRIFTGRARHGQEASAGGMFARGLRDWTNLAVGQKMWITAAGDGAALLANRVMSLYRGGMPEFANLTNPTVRHNRKTLNGFADALYGTAINKVLNTSFRGMRDALGEGNRAIDDMAAGFAYATKVASQNSMLRMMTHTTNFLTNQARNGVIGDVYKAAFRGDNPFTEAALKAADVAPEQFEGVLKAFRTHMSVGKDGQLRINEAALLDDPSMMALWRLTDTIATDVTMNTNRVGMMYSKHPNEMLQMVLQFKAFMLKGINGTFMRKINQAGQGQQADMALATLLAIPFGTASYAMNTHLNALRLDESDRQEYLDNQLSPSNLAYQGLSRSSITGAPLGLVNMVGSTGAGFAGNKELKDFFSAGRTTAPPAYIQRKEAFEGTYTSHAKAGENIMGTLSDNIPSVGVAAGALGATLNVNDAFKGEYGREQMEATKALKENLLRILPNDPITQALVNEMAVNLGVVEKYQ